MSKASVAIIIATCAIMLAILSLIMSQNRQWLREENARIDKPVKHQVALDCSRPQGRHRWIADIISIPTTRDEGTVVRLSNRDDAGNTNNTDIDVKGWLCVIDAEIPKAS